MTQLQELANIAMIPIFKDVKTKMFELNAQIGNTGKETETIK